MLVDVWIEPFCWFLYRLVLYPCLSVFSDCPSTFIQVWASGFSAAFLKKNSIATRGSANEPEAEVTVGTRTSFEVKPAFTEAALLLVLEKLFGVVLNYPSVHR